MASRLTDFLLRVAAYQRRNPRQRMGQALFNVLHDERPEYANAIRGTELDPFHSTSLPAETLCWIEQQFKAEAEAPDA